ncbi:MAG TPA: thioredoxin fold domain-containing protein [Ramlibacter sp.]|nr:thioredoxin fold domain-containing protein [Ramlibacter sp.]
MPFALAGLAMGPRAALAAEVTLPSPASLRAELDAALKAGKPLVVMASLEGCPYCKLVRESYLAPMLRETGQPIVQLDTGSAAVVLDFAGRATTHDQLLKAWGIKVTPTVLFFGKGAREAAPRLVGASIPDFYGAYLEQRVATARASLG